MSFATPDIVRRCSDLHARAMSAIREAGRRTKAGDFGARTRELRPAALLIAQWRAEVLLSVRNPPVQGRMKIKNASDTQTHPWRQSAVEQGMGKRKKPRDPYPGPTCEQCRIKPCICEHY